MAPQMTRRPKRPPDLTVVIQGRFGARQAWSLVGHLFQLPAKTRVALDFDSALWNVTDEAVEILASALHYIGLRDLEVSGVLRCSRGFPLVA